MGAYEIHSVRFRDREGRRRTERPLQLELCGVSIMIMSRLVFRFQQKVTTYFHDM